MSELSGVISMVTIPNLLTCLRALGIPIFLWLILDRDNVALAVLVLVLGGATDYLDGKIARALHQESRLGELLDPAVDRLYIISVLIALYATESIPAIVLLLVATRDLVLGAVLVAMKRLGLPPFTVTFLGKAATFNILYALPLLLLQKSTNICVAESAFILGWGFAGWGIALYLLTGVSYARLGVRELRASKRRGQ
jgi:cardiolipin synthase